ncbi:MAG TPA: hypothetical protein VI386_28320 [Candidatus Sulfotelmatobacter sp.]
MTSSFGKSTTAELTAAGIGVVFCNLGPPERLTSNISVDYQRGIRRPLKTCLRWVIALPGDNRTAITIKHALVAGLNARKLDSFPVIDCNYRVDSGGSACAQFFIGRRYPL